MTRVRKCQEISQDGQEMFKKFRIFLGYGQAMAGYGQEIVRILFKIDKRKRENTFCIRPS